MMFLDQTDVNLMKSFATLEAARHCNIKEANLKSYEEVDALITAINPPLSMRLDAFCEAYQAWFDFCLKLEKEGKQGKMNAEEHAEFLRVTSQRDDTRTALLLALGISV